MMTVTVTRDMSQSPAVEDYLKAIYTLTVSGAGAASTNDLAGRLDVSTGSVSAMVKRLGEAGLAEHAPYRGVELTPEGLAVALRVVRRHRLMELFLAEVLDMPWEDLHDEAEILEHSVSESLIDLIARKLGDPEFDPHGDPIPSRDLRVAKRTTERLAELQPGERATFVRVSDENAEMLRYLTERGIKIGDEVEMIAHEPFGGPFNVRIAGHEHPLGATLARAMQIQRS